MSSCNNALPKNQEVVINQKQNSDLKIKTMDSQFLVEAAEINLEEIELGILAQKNTNTNVVNQLGKMMQDEHTQALKMLQTMAIAKNIYLPTELSANGEEANTKLMNLKNMDFNTPYCSMMVNGHKSAIEKFEKISTQSTDSDIKVWAASLIPTLQTHLTHAINCQKQCEKM